MSLQKIRSVIFRSRQDKLAKVAQLFSDYLKGDVLDVGCDVKHLAQYTEGNYVGIDISGSPDIRCNVENGLPFRDKSFNSVFAFDILEHLENIHFAFDELCRVSRFYVIIGLPNMYEWHFRLMVLLGKQLSGKYGLPLEPPLDRHRWLFGIKEARDFVRKNESSFMVIEEVFGYYAYNRKLPMWITMLGKWLTPYGASLFAYHYWAVLKRRDKTG